MKLLKELICAFGISGYEVEVRNIIKREIKDYVDEVKIDKMGNLIAYKKGKPPRGMLAAHMDEVGLMIKSINDKGLIKCSTVGSLEAVSLIGAHVQIMTKTGKIYGIVTTKEMSNCEEITELPFISDIIVDTGLKKAELKKKGVDVGSYIELEAPTYFHFGKKLVGKSLDDRIGCYILCEVIKRCRKNPFEYYFVFTVQEEIGLHGARTSAYSIMPDWGLAVDVCVANDLMKEPGEDAISLGEGPTLTVMDNSMIASRRINTHIKSIAKTKKILLQFEVSDVGTTDASTILTSRGGVPASVLSIPVRNLHTTCSMAHQRDINNCILLLQALINKPPKIEVLKNISRM
ncbi:MAG: M42 family peptidase [Pseudomonadota bacterium]